MGLNQVTHGYLLDTNVASAVWDGGTPSHHDVRQRLAGLGAAIVFISAVTIAEIEYGLQAAPRIDRSRQSAVRNAMSSYSILDIDRHTANTYGGIRAVLFRTHSPRDRRGRLTSTRVEDLIERTTGKELGIQENDLWIMSVAVQYNLVFVTKDRMRHVIDAANYANQTQIW